MVLKLILLSPVGISSNYSEIVSTKIEDFLQSVFFKAKKSPAHVYKLFGGVVSNYVFNKVCDKNKFKGLTNHDEFIAYRDFLNCLFRNKSCSEKAIFNFFDKNLRAFKPLTYYYEFLKDIKILFLYGDVDWCPTRHALDLKELCPNNIDIDIVSESGHLLYNDNYEEMTDKILAYLQKEGNNNNNNKIQEEEVSSDTNCSSVELEEENKK